MLAWPITQGDVVLRLRGSERAVQKPDQFVSRLHQIDSYQNLLEDWAIQFTSSDIRALGAPSGSPFVFHNFHTSYCP
jgi:hypothetical protein